MEKSIIVDPISDNSVYGITQVEYTVDALPGQNFANAVDLGNVNYK